MTKVNQLFEVDEYLVEPDTILVNIFKDGKSRIVKIPREDFEKWLQDSGRLDWCEDRADYRGEHIQATGTLTIEEYWSEYDETKFPDLYDWLVLNRMGENAFDIQKPLSNILGGHFFTALNNALS